MPAIDSRPDPVSHIPLRVKYTALEQPSARFPFTPSHTLKMKFFESQHEFDYSWEEVSTANWQKYCPWNDKSTHVIAVDTLERSVDAVTGIVRPLNSSTKYMRVY